MKIKKWLTSLGFCLLLGGCVTLTPEQKKAEGEKAVANAANAEEVIEATIKYDVPAVYAAAVARLSNRDMFTSLLDLCAENESYRRREVRGKIKGSDVRVKKYLREEANKFTLSKEHVPSEIAAKREKLFEERTVEIGRDVYTGNKNLISDYEMLRIWNEWPDSSQFKLSLLDKRHKQAVKKIFTSVVENSFERGGYAPKRSYTFNQVYEVFEKMEKPSNEDILLMLASAAESFGEWSDHLVLVEKVRLFMQKEKYKTMRLYFTVEKWNSSLYCPHYMDRGGAFMKSMFDANMCAMAYELVYSHKRRVKDEFGDEIMGVDSKVRKWMVSKVSDVAVLKSMMLKVTGFGADEDIGINDALAKITNDMDMIEIATTATDYDVCFAAIDRVGDLAALLGRINKLPSKIGRIRLAKRTFMAASQKRDGDVKNAVLELFEVERKRILAEGKNKGNKTFVFNGFYPGMTLEDAEILLSSQEMNARIEIERETKTVGLFVKPEVTGRRFLKIDGHRFGTANTDKIMTSFDFSAKMLFDILGIEESNPYTWIREFRVKFDLPQFTDDVEQERFTLMGVHKTVTRNVFRYRHPNGWSIAYFGDATSHAFGSVFGVNQDMSAKLKGGNLKIQFDR